MKYKNGLCGISIAVVLQLGVLAASAQITNTYLYTGSERNITLNQGIYIITAYGAQGGDGGGLGAEMEGEFNIAGGTTLTLLVGGGGGSTTGYNAAGGGGGSFVVEGSTPLVVAGGGGSTAGSTGTAGVNGAIDDGAVGIGSGGTAGGGGGGSGGGGGGGFLGSGGSGGTAGSIGGGSGGSGGYGGGGGGYGYGSPFESGGGGGYSGGGGGAETTYMNGTGGGGGGSIIDSSAVAVLAEVSGVASPNDATGNGEIVIVDISDHLLQTISFGALPAVQANAAPFSLTATASSGLPISYTSSNTNVATVSGNTVTIVTYGSTTITASQAGNAAYQPATSVSQTLTVAGLTQTIYFAGWQSVKQLTDAPFGLNATASSGLPVIYASSNPGVATVSGNTVTVRGAGCTSITAIQSGDATRPPASVSKTLFVVAKNYGTVVEWGSGGYTTVPAGLSNVTAIATGVANTVVLKSDGTVVVWGDNSYGQTNIPAGLSNVVSISACQSAYNIVALESNGTVVAWGQNGSGETNVPAGLSGVTAVAAGDGFTAALKNDGTVVAWGYNYNGATNVPAGLNGVTAISASDCIIALKSDGTVVSWGGQNLFGEGIIPAGLSNVVAIAAGDYNSLALKSDGTIAGWGHDGYGEADVPAGLSNNVAAIAVGYLTSMALKSDGTVAAWGYSGGGVINVPAGLTGVTAVSGNGGGYGAAIGVIQPSITAQPQNLVVNATSNATFNVTATTGTASLSYQWYYNTNTALLNATNATLTLANVQTNQAGHYSVVVSNIYGRVTSSAALLTVNQLAQTINFGALASKLLGDAPFALSATASSSLPASYISSNPGVAAVNGNTVTITGAGSTTITAIQPGNATYLPAANVNQTLTVSPTTVQFTASPTFGGVPLTVQFTAPGVDSGGHAISHWNWNFGDGSTSTAQNPSHIYTSVGTNHPSLMAAIPYGFTVAASGPSITGLYLLFNGGFETGDFSGWSGGGNFTSCSVVTGPLYAHSGNYGAQMGPSGPALGYLYQMLPTASNGVYTLSFWLDSPDGLTPNEFSVVWDGTTLLDKKSWAAIGWTNLQYVVTASGTNTLLQFGFRDDNSFLGLDDVSVTPVAHPVIAGIHLSGTNLVLNGSSGLAGAVYITLVSTNLIQWTPVATNILGANGNFTITATNAVISKARQGYYRIQWSP